MLALCSFLVLMLAFCSCSEDEVMNTAESIEENNVATTSATKRTCGHTHHMNDLLSNPAFKESYNKRINNHLNYVKQHVGSRALCSSPEVIPVAVHFQGATGDLSCLVSLAEQAVAALNADFQGTNGDITNWTGNAASSYAGISHGEACLQFTLANQNHPSGYGLSNGDLAVTRNATNGDSDSDWSGYLNIFVGDAQGSLGYAPLGGAGTGDGVMIDKNYFGIGAACGNVGASAPFNLGRTLTHEVGHYLLLDHIWGNGCGQDDGVADTPNQESEYYDCPNIGVSSCGSTDLHMNYMDYVNDACMYMFTSGQATVTENYVASSLSILTNNVSSVISGSSTGGGGGGNTGSTCATPATISASVLSNTSARITFEAQAEASSYQLSYRVNGTTAWNSVSTTTAEYTLTGLAAGTTYDYRVRTNCPSGWTGFTTTQSFTTTGSTGGGSGASCDVPGSSDATYVNTKVTKVTWEAMPQAIRYQIRYRVQGTGSWITKSSTAAQKTLRNLQNGATYEYKIRTKCPSGWTGYTAIQTFEQSNGTGGGSGSSTNTVTFELILDNYGSETSFELINDANQVVEAGGPYNNGVSGQLITETFNIPDGCYTLYVDDSYGDGICCTYGDGSFSLLANSGTEVGYSDGNFGYYDYIDFCVTNNVVSLTSGDKDRKAHNLKPKMAHSE